MNTEEGAPKLTGEFAAAAAQYPRQGFYPDAYYDAKLAAAVTSEGPGHDVRQEPAEYLNGGEATFDVVTCLPFAQTRYSSDPEETFDQLAIMAVQLERSFIASGYSREVYFQPLLSFERRMIQLIERTPLRPADADQDYLQSNEFQQLEAATRETHDSFAQQAETLRAQLQPDQPRIIASGECGEGEDEYYVRTDPPGGRIWMLAPHSFKKCELRTRTPYNRAACRWPEIHPDAPANLSGRLYYQVQWPDGRMTTGERSFGYADAQEAADSDHPIVTIRR